jgi:enoyl-CoA hydratase
MEAALTGDRIPAPQLHRAGLINRLVPPGHALPAATALAHAISQNAPLALAATKQVIVQSADWPAAEQFTRQNQITTPVFTSADALEGAAAFTEKRPPVWRGQ